LPRAVGLLTGAATAICGASAALAVAAILPRSVSNDRFTSLTVLGAVSLSTLAMIAYPLLGRWLHLAPDQIAVLLGAAIHDVAQVAAAGGGVSPEVQELAVMVKLYRVSMLAPIVMALSMALGSGGWRRLTPPIYLLAFVACAILGNTGWIPDSVKSAALAVSSWCILLSVAAAGAKIVLADLLAQSHSVLGLMCIEALALLGAVLCLIAFAA